MIFKLSFGPESERVALIEHLAEGSVLEEAFKTCSKGKSYFGEITLVTLILLLEASLDGSRQSRK